MIFVRDDGNVAGVQVTKSPGAGMDQKAIDTLKQWKFSPAMKDGTAVAVYLNIKFNFSIAAASPLPAILATTDGAGNAVLTNVPSGRFVVVGKRDGLVGIGHAIVPSANQPVVLDLVAAANVRGRVRDPAGVPIPGVEVSLGFASEQGGRRVFIEGAGSFTDSDGEYSFASVMPGDFYLRVQRSGSSSSVYYPSSPDFERAVSIPVGAGKDVVGIDIEVPSK